MQGVLIDDHRIHVDFSQSVRENSSAQDVMANVNRSPSSLIPGGIQRIQREPSNPEDLEAYQV